MRETEYAYAVAKIRANELSLISSSQMETVIAAPDYETAVKLLAEMGFADLEGENEETVLKEKEQQAFKFICEIAPDKALFDFLVVKNDFHNIKAVLKSLVVDTDYAPYVLEPCLIAPSDIYSAAVSKDWKSLPSFAVEAVKKGYELVTATKDGQVLDVYLDKCYLETSIKMAKESKEDFSVGLAERTALIADLQIALRGSEMGKSKEFLKNAMADCGILDTDRIIPLSLAGKKEISDYLKENGMEAMADALLKSNSAFEKAADNYLLDYVKGAKYESFGISPLIGYYLARMTEVKTVRILLCCKRTGLTEGEIKERVRSLYV